METKEDILDIVGPVPIPEFPWMTLAIIAGALLAVGAIIFAIMRLMRPAPPVVPSARARALERLRELRARIGAIDAYQLSIHVSDTLRDFLSATLRIPATRQTSPEFLGRLRETHAVADAQRDRIAAFLERVDMTKFAHDIPPDSELDPLIGLAVKIVEDQPATPS